MIAAALRELADLVDAVDVAMAERIQRLSAPTESGCWQWTGWTNPAGYGYLRLTAKKRARAHRVSYEAFVGPIPDGLQLDHLCRNRACVNPAHLEPVTARVNVMRSTAPTAVNAVKTHCDSGHEFTEENTYVYASGKRRCRTCAREWNAGWRARRAAARS